MLPGRGGAGRGMGQSPSSMFVLFDEAGKFQAGRILSEAEASAQVELDSGKRVKVKAANQLLRFDKPAPAELLAQAQALVAELDPAQLAWEFAPTTRTFADLAAATLATRPLWRSRPRRCWRCTRRTLLQARRQGAPQGAGRDRGPGAGRHREEKSSWPPRSPANHELAEGRARAGGEQPQDPVPARQERARVQRPWWKPRAPAASR